MTWLTVMEYPCQICSVYRKRQSHLFLVFDKSNKTGLTNGPVTATFSEHLRSPLFVVLFRVAQSLVFCVNHCFCAFSFSQSTLCPLK